VNGILCEKRLDIARQRKKKKAAADLALDQATAAESRVSARLYDSLKSTNLDEIEVSICIPLYTYQRANLFVNTDDPNR
jgi:hypothetical protein